MRAMTRWEYNTVSFKVGGIFQSGSLDGDAFQGKLDELGRDGWELVSVFDTNAADGSSVFVVAVFKRPLK